jgi:hypothetical protein
MATSLQNLVCDSSTLTNFKSWAQAISTFIGTTAGWTQSADTGQVNWSTISSVPGSNAYVYEIWEPNDSLANFYMKIQYGNTAANANNPTVIISISQSTDGAGNLTGTVLGPWASSYQSFTGFGSTQYECRFSGEPGRLSLMLWRNIGSPGNAFATFAFGVERSLNSSGAYTGTYVTMTMAQADSGQNRGSWYQQTLHFTAGLAPAPSAVQFQKAGGMPCRMFFNGAWSVGAPPNAAFNGSIPFDTYAPFVGFWDYPGTNFGVPSFDNVSEGQIFSTTLYGSTRTYIVSANGGLGNATTDYDFTNFTPLAMRWD